MKKHTITQCRIVADGQTLFYDIEFSARRSVAIIVRQPNATVVVKAPVGIRMQQIESFVRQKASWIVKHQQNIRSIAEKRLDRRYENGSIHLLLGSPFLLQITTKPGKATIEQQDGIVSITLPQEALTEENVKKMLDRWYAQQATAIFPDIITPLANDFIGRHAINKQVRFVFKKVSSYWGVCTSRGIIRLNIELVRAPIACIEYIVVHELCHLIHHNHSADFYRLLDRELPDWKERKKLLEQTISCRQ